MIHEGGLGACVDIGYSPQWFIGKPFRSGMILFMGLDALPDSGFGGFIETYGATPVSGKNMLLSQGDAVLLYPGGAREALKCKDEKYKLVWPAEQEFVRLAARFGAWIVPFAGIGGK
eukprot:gene389-1785_t